MTFIKHLQLLKVDMSSKGSIFEKENRSLLKRANLKVHNGDYKFSYFSSKEKKTIDGDIDVIAWDEKYLFIAEVKNHLDPIEPEDYRGAKRIVKKAHCQLRKIISYIDDNKRDFCEIVGISEDVFESLEIVPFIVISGYYMSGEKYEDIQIVDYNSLEKYIDDGYLAIVFKDKILKEVALRENPGSIEIKNFLESPYYYGLDGCYAPMFYQQNMMPMPNGILIVCPNLPKFDEEKYKFKELFPNEEKMKKLLEPFL